MDAAACVYMSLMAKLFPELVLVRVLAPVLVPPLPLLLLYYPGQHVQWVNDDNGITFMVHKSARILNTITPRRVSVVQSIHTGLGFHAIPTKSKS